MIIYLNKIIRMQSPIFKKTSLLKQYFSEQKKYTKIYGEKTILFFEMGNFYESYCTSKYGYTDLLSICQIIEMSPAHREHVKNGFIKPTKVGIPVETCEKMSEN